MTGFFPIRSVFGSKWLASPLFRSLLPILAAALFSQCEGDTTVRGGQWLPSSSDAVQYTDTNYTFDGGLASLQTTIAAASDDEPFNVALEIEGVVTIRSAWNWADYSDVSDYSDPGVTNFRNYLDCFFLQDSGGAVFVLYDRDYTFVDNIQDEGYIPGLVQPGDRVRLKVTSVQKYSSANMAVVRKFIPSDVEIVSRGNPVYVEDAPPAWSAGDIGKVFRISGSVDQQPPYVEYSENVPSSWPGYCANPCDTEYQVNMKKSFVSTLTSDSQSWSFQLNLALVRGALDSFALGNGESSFTVLEGDELTITGPLLALDTDTSAFEYAIAVEDRIQVARQNQTD
jgi:hypothetical protein